MTEPIDINGRCSPGWIIATGIAVSVGILAVLAALVFAALLLTRPAHAHSWYSGTNDPVTQMGCCGGTDCAEIPDADVRQTASGGYVYLPTGEEIPQSRVQRSRDWRFHRCKYLSTFTNANGTFKAGDTRCFFAPPGSM